MNQHSRIHIGFRTLKTAVAVIIAMIIVSGYGVSGSKLIFAMLGAMAAITPTFKDSLESCVTQIFGVLFGAIMSVILLSFSLPPLVMAGIGIVVVITLYNAFRIRFSPSLPCMIVVMMATASNIQPFAYAFERIWDSTIGLGVGLIINTLVFPYDNSRLIKSLFENLLDEFLVELESMFVGGESKVKRLTELCKDMDYQIDVYSKQVLVYKYKKQKELLAMFVECQEIVWKMEAYMDVLSTQNTLGTLNKENQIRLLTLGVNLMDYQTIEEDYVVNAHVKVLYDFYKELKKKLKKPNH